MRVSTYREIIAHINSLLGHNEVVILIILY